MLLLSGMSVYIDLPLSFTSLVILVSYIFRTVFTRYFIVFSQSRICRIFHILHFYHRILLYAFLHNKAFCLRTYFIINVYQRFVVLLPLPFLPPPFSRPARFPLATYFIRILHFQLRSPYVYTNVAAIFIPLPPTLCKLIPSRLRARSLCISKRTYALVASSTIP